MAQVTPQTYANHARLHPPFHYFLGALVLLAIVLSVIAFVRHPAVETVTLLVLAIALLLNSAIMRGYSLKVQDRLIRLEERSRLSMLVPEAFKPRVAELTVGQLVALRFASDPEVPALAARALNERLSNKQIKQAILTWRPDDFRV